MISLLPPTRHSLRASRISPLRNSSSTLRLRGDQRGITTMANIPSLKLNDGTSIPVLGYGTGTAWFKKSASDALDQNLITATKSAIKLGYKHLDGAEVYNTERELGQAIKESAEPRENLFVTTKVKDDSIKDIPAALDASLQKLGLEYVDLYLIHSPFFGKSASDYQTAWKAMEAVKKSGKARSIGVSNWLPSHLEHILPTATVVPSMNQVEYHPYLQHVASSSKGSDGSDFQSFHKKHGIQLTSYGPLTTATRAKGGPVDAVVDKLAAKYGVEAGEILLRWVIDSGIVAVTTSSKEERQKEYLQALTFSLEKSEVDEISKLGQEKHFRAFWKHIFAEDDRS